MARAIIILISCGLLSAARSAPSVVSINLCTDQLLLNVAAADQILSLSWLAADADESMLADSARAYPANFATAEEILALNPDVVLAGRYSNPYTKALLRRLGFTVLEIAPARNIGDVAGNLLRIGDAIDRTTTARSVVAAMQARVADLRSMRAGEAPVPAVVIRPGGYTIDRNSIASEMLELTGVSDRALAMGLDRWGSLSVETLLRANPEFLIVTDYKLDTASLANAWYSHPAITSLAREVPNVRLPGRYWACGVPQTLNSVELLIAALTVSE